MAHVGLKLTKGLTEAIATFPGCPATFKPLCDLAGKFQLYESYIHQEESRKSIPKFFCDQSTGTWSGFQESGFRLTWKRGLAGKSLWVGPILQARGAAEASFGRDGGSVSAGSLFSLVRRPQVAASSSGQFCSVDLDAVLRDWFSRLPLTL